MVAGNSSKEESNRGGRWRKRQPWERAVVICDYSVAIFFFSVVESKAYVIDILGLDRNKIIGVGKWRTEMVSSGLAAEVVVAYVRKMGKTSVTREEKEAAACGGWRRGGGGRRWLCTGAVATEEGVAAAVVEEEREMVVDG
ncbi:hypothetical protein B296_00033388 [Ensete ventricosum]|uniref:Uncharacterized protein n=1 Tax=Ensete ventricosum TaxID=4639 RepID=A0A426WZG4_ENSVE|nr:hypothetical protein B296_00033388 [Ensete ventricosum]